MGTREYPHAVQCTTARHLGGGAGRHHDTSQRRRYDTTDAQGSATMKGAADYRRAISGQTRAARAAWPDMVECARCHNTLTKADAHVDHHPVPLAVLIRAFLDLASLGRVAPDRDAWRTYHAREATLVPSCAGCNIAANPRGQSWASRRRRTA